MPKRSKGKQAGTAKPQASGAGAVMVVGGGVAGVQASLDLANSGFKVYLVEGSPAIGGRMAQLDKTFPTNDCSMCILSPKLIECAKHINVELITYASVEKVEGEAGNFKVRVLKAPGFVDEEKCTGCGTCIEKCPWKAPSEFEMGLGQRKAIYIPYAQAVPNIPVIDTEHCAYFQKGTCRACERFCPTGAIDFEQKERPLEVEVGALILAPGYEPFDPHLKGEYAYGRARNVVTSLEFERLLSASGPNQGDVLRPSDRGHPHKIAWLQCVGSRDPSIGYGYCSAVCCTYAIKQMIIAREHLPGVEVAVFSNDIRTFGKGFEEYYQAARATPGIRFIKGIVSAVKELQQTKSLLLTYATDEGGVVEEEFDMVVLSVGLRPSESSQELAHRLGVGLDRYGFCATEGFSPVETSRPGIFVAGAFSAPMDIPESVTMASAAASLAGRVAGGRGTQVKVKEYPPERDVSGEELRIGVFVCHCGINIASVVDVPQVVEYASTLPGVVHGENNLFSCSADATSHIAEVIKEKGLNRVVVASCTPRTHEPLFQEVLREAGLNKYLFEMANIRDQCSWVHMKEPEAATKKAKDLVRMAVARVGLSQALEEASLGVVQRGLVIGGGAAGMTAALGLAGQGFEVYLVEREAELGGNMRHLRYTLEGEEVGPFMESLIERVEANPLIRVYKGAEVEKVEGSVGNYKTTLSSGEQLEHGAVIVATGGREYKPSEYLYGKHGGVITQQELERKLGDDAASLGDVKDVVMVQCVGSRTEERPYCSRVCCGQAVKNALKLKEQSPEVNIYILYRDMRTYGLKEDRYLAARQAGVTFIRYEPEAGPEVVDEGGRLRVRVLDRVLRRRVVLRPDLVVLSAATVPEENDELARMLKVPRTEDGFFLEAHVKLRPVDFATAGVFLCGLAHSPKYLDEAIVQAEAAASRAATLLSKGVFHSEGIVASVDKDACSGCKLCVQVCPYGVMSFNEEEGVAQVNEMLCAGCGNCAAACPSGACYIKGFRDSQILAQIEALV